MMFTICFVLLYSILNTVNSNVFCIFLAPFLSTSSSPNKPYNDQIIFTQISALIFFNFTRHVDNLFTLFACHAFIFYSSQVRFAAVEIFVFKKLLNFYHTAFLICFCFFR